jgi:hypothetical protein
MVHFSFTNLCVFRLTAPLSVNFHSSKAWGDRAEVSELLLVSSVKVTCADSPQRGEPYKESTSKLSL